MVKITRYGEGVNEYVQVYVPGAGSASIAALYYDALRKHHEADALGRFCGADPADMCRGEDYREIAGKLIEAEDRVKYLESELDRMGKLRVSDQAVMDMVTSERDRLVEGLLANTEKLGKHLADERHRYRMDARNLRVELTEAAAIINNLKADKRALANLGGDYECARLRARAELAEKRVEQLRVAIDAAHTIAQPVLEDIDNGH